MDAFSAARRELLKYSSLGLVSAAAPFASLAQTSGASEAGSAARIVFDVRSFGATGDGKTLDTPAINKAIAAAATAGGGTVFFPGGT